MSSWRNDLGERIGMLLFWPLVLLEKRDERRRAEERERFYRWVAQSNAYRCYVAAASQAAQASGDGMFRVLFMAIDSLRAGDALMRNAGMRPEDHDRRGLAKRRIDEKAKGTI